MSLLNEALRLTDPLYSQKNVNWRYADSHLQVLGVIVLHIHSVFADS